MSSSPQYVSAVAGSQAPVLMTKANSLPIANFLTAANPSSANGGLGSNYLINSGTGVLYYAPSLTLSSIGVPNSTQSDVTTQVATGAGAWPGGALAVSPQTGQTYSGYSIVLPTSDPNTPVFSAGNLTVTNAAVTAGAVAISSLSLQTLAVQAVGGAPQYFTVSSTSAALSVPLALAGVTSSVSIFGVPATSKLAVANSSGASIFNVNTSSAIVTVGSVAQGATLDVTGSLTVEGGASTQKLLVTSASTTILQLDTVGGTLAISNVDTHFGGGVVISGPAEAQKLAVYNNDLTPQIIFEVNTATEQVIVEGDVTSGKLQVLDGGGLVALSVDTGANQAADMIHAVTIAAAVGTATCGTASAPWATVYATNGTIQPSDARLKTRLAGVDARSCLRAVRAIEPILWRWNDASCGDEARLGMTAQNVRAAIEDLKYCGVNASNGSDVTPSVVRDEAGTLMVEMIQLLPVLIGAIQALEARVVELERE